MEEPPLLSFEVNGNMYELTRMIQGVYQIVQTNALGGRITNGEASVVKWYEQSQVWGFDGEPNIIEADRTGILNRLAIATRTLKI